jgi:hypothetical protein
VFRERVKEPRRKCTAFNKQGPAFLPSVIREIHFRIRTAPRELLIEPAEHGTLKPFCRTILVFQLSHHRAMRILSVVPNGHTCKLIIDRNESKRLNRYAAKPGRPFHQLIMLLPPHRLHVAKVGPLRERLSPFYPLPAIWIVHHLATPSKRDGETNREHQHRTDDIPPSFWCSLGRAYRGTGDHALNYTGSECYG